MKDKTIALCVTGSIAAFKAVLVARLLVVAGARVVPVMTSAATRFVGAVTLAGICGEAVRLDPFDPATSGEVHVDLGAEADAVLVVPATADALARLAQGRADDLVSALALCARGPVLAAPAMHPRMWDHPATQRNIEEIRRQGRVILVGPERGLVASGEVGLGRMSEPEAIVAALRAALDRAVARRDLEGLSLVVTAGPTAEDIDPVRFVGNRSSGKMGFAVAERAARRGAKVTLIAGPVPLATPPGVVRVEVRTALDVQRELDRVLGDDLSGADALIMAAAVADYRPRTPSATKLKKTGAGLTIELVPNPDVLAGIGARRTKKVPYLVGFALETSSGAELLAAARQKLAGKRIDLVVANEAADSLMRDDNRATLVTADAAEELPPMPKGELADVLLDRVLAARPGLRSGTEPG